MCTVSSHPTIAVGLTVDEARRVGDLNIDLKEIEIIRFRRKVRDAVKKYDEAQAKHAAFEVLTLYELPDWPDGRVNEIRREPRTDA